MIGRYQTIALADHLKLALDHGVKPTEISEIITHLAFYSGWANAVAAAAVAKDVMIFVYWSRVPKTRQMPKPPFGA